MTMRIPINRHDDGELLGFAVSDATGWQAQTVFGYVFARADDQESVEQAVRSQGQQILQGVWQYLDADDKQWHPCVLAQIAPLQVTVIRTNEMGYQDPETVKHVVIRHPDDTRLVKS